MQESSSGSQRESKDGLRKMMREKMRAISMGQRAQWSAAVLDHLRSREDWVPEGGLVVLFGGMASEPNLLPLIPWLRAKGLRTAFFAIEGDVMTPYLVQDEQDLVPGVLGVLEPWREPTAKVSIEEITLALVPGIAFSTTNGIRLGRGKGHYDRALTRLPESASRIGVCFHTQLLPEVPAESHDRRVQRIVTEQGWVELG